MKHMGWGCDGCGNRCRCESGLIFHTYMGKFRVCKGEARDKDIELGVLMSWVQRLKGRGRYEPHRGWERG